MKKASETIEDGDVRMVLLGPSYRDDEAMEQIRTLHNQDPGLVLMMVAEEVTADLLRKGMRAGVSDVLEAPLDESKIEAAIEQFAHDILKRETAIASPSGSSEGESSARDG